MFPLNTAILFDLILNDQFFLIFSGQSNQCQDFNNKSDSKIFIDLLGNDPNYV